MCLGYPGKHKEIAQFRIINVTQSQTGGIGYPKALDYRAYFNGVTE